MESKSWLIKGNFIECCAQVGHCPLRFGRDIPGGITCESFVTLKINEGHINDVDMKDIVLIYLRTGIGPKYSDIIKGLDKGASM